MQYAVIPDTVVEGIRKQRRTGFLAQELASLPTRLEVAASKHITVETLEKRLLL